MTRSLEDLPVDHGVRAALAAWSLEPVTAITPATSGTMNETFVISTEDEQVVLRRHRRTDRKLIEHEHAVIAHAQRAQVPTPAAIPTQDGDYVVDRGGAFYSLFAFARGSQISADQLTPARAWSMGQALARIHLALADLPVRSQPPAPQHRLADTIDAITVLVERIEQRPEHDERDHWALQHLRSKLN